jgi:hypothetical protein
MNLVARVQAILLKPKEEWVKIKNESTPPMSLFMSYVIPLAAISAIAQFIGYGLIGFRVPFAGWYRIPLGTSLIRAILSYVLGVASLYLAGFVVNALAPSFGSKQNLDNAMKLVVYAMTPMWVGGIFYLLPPLRVLAMLAGLYGLYLLFLGFQTPLMETPQDKVISYLVVSIVVIAVLTIVAGVILGAFFAVGSVYSGM